MNVEIEEIRSCVRRKDIKTALSLIASLEGTSGPVPPLQVLKAICLQLSNEASLEEVEASLLSAIEMDDQYVDSYIELGWFRLNVLDDVTRASEAFDRARVLVAKLNGEVFRGIVACADELHSDGTPKTIREELRRSLLAQAEDDQE